jgi:hypothetical protein
MQDHETEFTADQGSRGNVPPRFLIFVLAAAITTISLLVLGWAVWNVLVVPI